MANDTPRTDAFLLTLGTGFEYQPHYLVDLARQLERELHAYEDALAFYADVSNWVHRLEYVEGIAVGISSSVADYDGGQKARQVMLGSGDVKL